LPICPGAGADPDTAPDVGQVPHRSEETPLLQAGVVHLDPHGLAPVGEELDGQGDHVGEGSCDEGGHLVGQVGHFRIEAHPRGVEEEAPVHLAQIQGAEAGLPEHPGPLVHPPGQPHVPGKVVAGARRQLAEGGPAVRRELHEAVYRLIGRPITAHRNHQGVPFLGGLHRQLARVTQALAEPAGQGGAHPVLQAPPGPHGPPGARRRIDDEERFHRPTLLRAGALRRRRGVDSQPRHLPPAGPGRTCPAPAGTNSEARVRQFTPFSWVGWVWAPRSTSTTWRWPWAAARSAAWPTWASSKSCTSTGSSRPSSPAPPPAAWWAPSTPQESTPTR